MWPKFSAQVILQLCLSILGCVPIYSMGQLSFPKEAEVWEGLAASSISAGNSVMSGPLLRWKPSYQLPSAPRANRVIFANNLFVAFGLDIMSSPDGKNWTTQNFKPPVQIFAMTFGMERFVAVGTIGDNQGFVLTSNDGAQWTLASQFPEGLRSVSFGNGVFIAVGNRKIYSSADGYTWVPTSAPGASEEYSSFGGGRFVSVGHTITISTNGSHWTERAPIHAGYNLFRAVIYANGVYVAAGEFIYFSTNAVSWTGADVQLPGGATLFGLSYGNGKFVALGSLNDGNGFVFTSNDGIQWTRGPVLKLNQPRGVAFGNGRFVATDQIGNVTTSTNGSTWDHQLLVVSKSVLAVAESQGTFVGVGMQGEWPNVASFLATSADGRSWTQQDAKLSDLLIDVVGGNGTFVTVGNSFSAYTSSNRTDWVESKLPPAYGRSLFWVNGFFFATVDGKLFRSQDGLNWTECGTGPDHIHAVTYGKGMFMAVGGAPSYLSNVIFTSTNAIDWVRQPQQPGNALVGVAFGNGRFVATQWLGPTLVSLDGANWSSHAFSVSFIEALKRVHFIQGRFVARGAAFKQFWISNDGIQWQENSAPAAGTVISYAMAGNRIYAVDSGNIWESDPLPPLFTVNVTANDDSFQIQRFSNESVHLGLEIPYAVAITSRQGSTLNHTNTAIIPPNQTATQVYVAPRDFAKATLTLIESEAYDTVALSSATLSLPEGDFIPRIRRSIARVRDRIRLTVDAPRNSTLVFEESADLKVWTPAGVYTNQMDVLEVDFQVKTNTPVFYCVRTSERQ